MGRFVFPFSCNSEVQNKVNTLITDPLIRLTELYLNYAKAANEAYGPNGKAPDALLSAVEALNKIRERVGMLLVKTAYTSDMEVFRKRIKNERTIELYGEGHHYPRSETVRSRKPVCQSRPAFL